MGGYYGIVKILQNSVAYIEQELYDPYIFESHYIQKIAWFFKEPFINSINLWNIFPNTYVTVFVVSVMVVGSAIYVFRELRTGQVIIRKLSVGLLTIATLILLSFLPNLLAPGKTAFYRCALALTPIVFLIFLWGVMQIITLFPKAARSHVVTLVLSGLLIYGSYQAQFNILNYRIVPSQRELAYIKEQLRRPDLYQFKAVHFIRANSQKYKRFQRYDEFGVPATAFNNNNPWILKCALREIGMEPFFWHVYPYITQGEEVFPVNSQVLVKTKNDVNGFFIKGILIINMNDVNIFEHLK